MIGRSSPRPFPSPTTDAAAVVDQVVIVGGVEGSLARSRCAEAGERRGRRRAPRVARRASFARAVNCGAGCVVSVYPSCLRRSVEPGAELQAIYMEHFPSL
jgi:hypothetical protein